MIEEVLLLTGGVVLITIIATYVTTVLPFFWTALIKYIDKKIEEEVKKYMEAELGKKMEELERVNQEIQKREETILLLKRTVGRKLNRDEIVPIEISKHSTLPFRGPF